MNPELRRILNAKEAERRRIRELPMLEKLEILDQLRDRELWLRQFRQSAKNTRVPEKDEAAAG